MQEAEQNFALQTTFNMGLFCFLSPQGSEVGVDNCWEQDQSQIQRFL